MAMNPVIKFTTLFGLLAVELAVEMTRNGQQTLTRLLAAAFLSAALVFVWRSFYRMRIGVSGDRAGSGDADGKPFGRGDLGGQDAEALRAGAPPAPRVA